MKLAVNLDAPGSRATTTFDLFRLAGALVGQAIGGLLGLDHGPLATVGGLVVGAWLGSHAGRFPFAVSLLVILAWLRTRRTRELHALIADPERFAGTFRLVYAELDRRGATSTRHVPTLRTMLVSGQNHVRRHGYGLLRAYHPDVSRVYARRGYDPDANAVTCRAVCARASE